MALVARLARRLDERRLEDGLRARRRIDSAQTAAVRCGARTLVNFCSNDYLGLAAGAALREALARGAREYGVGAGASHLVTGHMAPHHALEERLAEFTGAQRALLFSTGYMANVAVIGALVSRNDVVLADRLNHASLVDGGVVSRARVLRYRHCDARDARARLGSRRNPLVVTDGVFSMDGDVAPVAELCALVEASGGALLLDDAHGFGVLGEGRGARAHFGLGADPVVMGTLGKALGVFGAFVAGRCEVVEALIQFARPYVYSTALPPALAVAVDAALDCVERDAWRRRRLFENVAEFKELAARRGVPLLPSDTPIQPVPVGASRNAVSLSEFLSERGFLVAAIRPPTVPRGGARLRVTLCAHHERAQVRALVECLEAGLAALPRV